MSERLLDQTVTQFLDVLASKAPTPGGGSVAAVSAAMAAGLLTMVCDLTMGKKAYAAFDAEAQQIRERAETHRATLQALADADVAAFERLSAAYKLPRATEADAASRRVAIQAATKHAADVPLEIARTTVQLLPLCAPLAQHGNRMAVSDVGVAALLIQAAVPSALLNVDINVAALEDQPTARALRAEASSLREGVQSQVGDILALVQQQIGG